MTSSSPSAIYLAVAPPESHMESAHLGGGWQRLYFFGTSFVEMASNPFIRLRFARADNCRPPSQAGRLPALIGRIVMGLE